MVAEFAGLFSNRLIWSTLQMVSTALNRRKCPAARAETLTRSLPPPQCQTLAGSLDLGAEPMALNLTTP